jgi:hypothetical protein
MQFFDKSSHFLALSTFCTIHVQGLADDNLVHFVVLRKIPQNLKVRLKILASNRGTRLSRKQQRIAYGYADGFVADIESHNSHIFMIPAGVSAGL